MNALGTVQDHNDVINVHELRQIVREGKNKKAVGNDGFPSEVYKFASEQLLTMMSIFLSGCMITGKLPSTLMHIVIIPLLKCKSKDPADVNNCRSTEIATVLSNVLASLAVATRQVPVDCRQPIWFQASTFALKQTVDFYCNQDTPVCMCFLDAKKRLLIVFINGH